MGNPQGVQRSVTEEGGRISHTGSEIQLKEKTSRQHLTYVNKEYTLNLVILLFIFFYCGH